MSKVLHSVDEAIRLLEIKDGMTVSFHHHLRNGDYVLNTVMAAIANAGIKNIKVNASSLFDVHEPLLDHIRNGVVTDIETAYMGAKIGSAISHGILQNPVTFRTHGSRGAVIANGTSPVDVAFIAAPTSDEMGNCTGKTGKSACGSLGYAFADAQYAKHVVIITDNLIKEPLENPSITGERVDYVVEMESIGNPANAIRQLKALLGCDRLVVFGDGRNDLDMFRFADESYAVSNAVEELKEAATAVIGSNDEDGVAKWLLEHVQA